MKGEGTAYYGVLFENPAVEIGFQPITIISGIANALYWFLSLAVLTRHL